MVDIHVPAGHTRCQNNKHSGQCRCVFPTEFRLVKGEPREIVTCLKHRRMNVAKVTKRAQTPEGKANRQGIMKEYRKSGKMAESSARYWRSPKGRANQKRENAKMSRKLLTRINVLLRDAMLESVSLQKQTEFVSNQDVRDHLESTFDLS